MEKMRRWGLQLLCLALMVSSPSVFSGDWIVTNSLNLDSYFSDNLNHRIDANPGLVLSASPQLSLRGKGRRISGALSYSPTVYTAFGDDVPDSGVNHFLAANFTSTLVRNTLFLDSSASAGLISINNAANATTADLSSTSDTRQTYSLSVSPYTRHRLGSFAELSFRLGLNTVQGESGASNLNSTGVSASASLSSGPRFTRFPWSLSLIHSEVSYDVRTDTSDSLKSTVGYRIDRRWRVDGSLGYQKSQLLTSRGDTAGVTYSAGLYWTPNPRARADAEYGRSYFGDFWRVHGEHQSRRTRFTLDLSREITNARSLLLQYLTLGELANSDGLLAEQAQALLAAGYDPEFLTYIPQYGILNEDYLNTRVSAGIQLTGKRTTVSVNANWTERSYEISSNTEQIMGLSLQANRQMGGGINANANVSWQDVDSTFSGASQYLSLGVGASRSLGRYSRIGLNLSRQQRTSDGGGAIEFTEHRIGLTLTTRMF